MSTTTRLMALVAAGLACAALAGCGGDGDDAPADGAAASATAPTAPTTTGAADSSGTIEGTFDVGDHKLYLRSTGSGSPTVVYLHGYIEEEGGAESAGIVPSLLEERHRVCVYERPTSA